MLKRTLAILLSAALLLSPYATAMAAEPLDERLAAITRLVKQTLEVPEDYTKFYGNLTGDGLKNTWSLNWSKELENLQITVEETGRILSYNHYIQRPYTPYSSFFAPAFPEVRREDAQKSADQFLRKVLAPNETFRFIESEQILNPTDVDVHYFNGIILIHGLETPIRFNISIYSANLSVYSFSRSDLYTQYTGPVPDPTPGLSSDKAMQTLADTDDLVLTYVFSSLSTANSPTAVLHYLPKYTGNYVVDAKSGALIDIDKLYAELNQNPDLKETSDSAPVVNAASRLTEVEQEGIQKLEGALTEDQLEDRARAYLEIGLTADFVRTYVSYAQNIENGEVSATIQFTKRSSGTDQPEFYAKTLSLNGKTGELISLWSSYPYHELEGRQIPDASGSQTTAEHFLKKYFPDEFAETALYKDGSTTPIYPIAMTTNNPSVSFTFTRSANGIFMPANALNISINSFTGTVDSFSKTWTEDLTFESPDGIVSAENAKATYHAAFSPKLSYVMFPKSVAPSDPIYPRAVERGITYVNALMLGYTRTSDPAVLGVDAKSGKLIQSESVSVEKPTEYTDLEHSYAKEQILALAKYGIGFSGPLFKPAQALTQLDMLVLLLSAMGYRTVSEAPSTEEIDSIYNSAYNLRLLEKGERKPDQVISRGELVKKIIGVSGYGLAAGLRGIYAVSFRDAALIPKDLVGYVAIAQGLKMIRGDNHGKFNADLPVTRADAAIMIFNFMSREK